MAVNNAILRLKSSLIGSALEPIAQQARRLIDQRKWRAHPELWEIYLESERMPTIVGRLLKRNSNAVDVGCHLGSFLALLYATAPDGKHIAVEAARSKGDRLRRKFPRATIHTVAAGRESGSATFEENLAASGYSRLGNSASSSSIHYEVEVRRLDDLIDHPVDLIKLDIEGGELDALKGATATLDRYQPALLFECGSEYNNPPPPRRELYDFLTEHGYGIQTFGDLLFDKGPMGFDEFRRCGLYPFRAFNFVATPATS